MYVENSTAKYQLWLMRRREVILETKTHRFTAEYLLHSVQLALRQPPGDALKLSISLEHSELGEILSTLLQSCLSLVWCRDTPRRQVTLRQHLLGPFVHPIASILSSERLPTSEKKLQTGR